MNCLAPVLQTVMNGILVDTNVILDLFLDDPVWANWSETVLTQYSVDGALYINPIIYAELSIGFTRIEEMEEAISRAGFEMLALPKEALFLAGKVFLRYRQSGGTRPLPLPDFFIGAHAAVLNIPLMTRDGRRYRTYFPTLQWVTPE